jgi:pyridinium-3,5-bisthiocarboxylic acid mononucleotide nickel chelatase
MKKGRPGHLLTALAREEDVSRVEAVFFRETTTFGVRRYPVARTVLAREIVRVPTEWGEVEVKLGRLNGGGVLTATPEYESARRVAEAKGVALRAVLDAARASARVLTSGGGVPY